MMRDHEAEYLAGQIAFIRHGEPLEDLPRDQAERLMSEATYRLAPLRDFLAANHGTILASVGST
jgi:hypothetical protein